MSIATQRSLQHRLCLGCPGGLRCNSRPRRAHCCQPVFDLTHAHDLSVGSQQPARERGARRGLCLDVGGEPHARPVEPGPGGSAGDPQRRRRLRRGKLVPCHQKDEFAIDRPQPRQRLPDDPPILGSWHRWPARRLGRPQPTQQASIAPKPAAMVPEMVASDGDQPGERLIPGRNVVKAPPGDLVRVRQEILEILTGHPAVASITGEDRVRRLEQLAEPRFTCHYIGSCLNRPQRYRR